LGQVAGPHVGETWTQAPPVQTPSPSAVQFTHVCPTVPHAFEPVPGWQFPVESQQPEHVAALQPCTCSQSCAVELHDSLGGHATHEAPCPPQLELESPCMHFPSLQQPLGLVAGPHGPES
jgi:hypothetical protein